MTCPHWIDGKCCKGQQALPIDSKRAPSRQAFALAEKLRKALEVSDEVWKRKRYGWALSADRALESGWRGDELLRLSMWGLELGFGIGSIPQLIEKAPRIRRRVEGLQAEMARKKAGLTEGLFNG